MIPKRLRIEQTREQNALILSRYKGPVYIWGSSNSMKLSNLRDSLVQNQCTYSYVNCEPFVNTLSLFQKLYNNLYVAKREEDGGMEVDKQDGGEQEDYHTVQIEEKVFENRQVPTIYELTELLYEQIEARDTMLYLIFDNVECIKSDNHLLLSLLKVDEITSSPVCIFLLSEMPPDVMLPQTEYLMRPRSIHYPQLTQPELVLSLTQNEPDHNAIVKGLVKDPNVVGPPQIEQVKLIYQRFCQWLVDIFYQVSRDLRLLVVVGHRLYSVLLEHAISSTPTAITIKEVGLYGFITPYIHFAYHNIYELHKVTPSKTQMDTIMKAETSKITDSNQTELMALDDTSVLSMGLSFHSKCLLIASFLASSYPQTKDKLYFSGEKIHKRTSLAREKKTEPKWFNYNRLIAILLYVFKSEIDIHIRDSIELSQVISFLCGVHLLDRSGDIDARYRCNIPFFNMKIIANSIKFNLESYVANIEFTHVSK